MLLADLASQLVDRDAGPCCWHGLFTGVDVVGQHVGSAIRQSHHCHPDWIQHVG